MKLLTALAISMFAIPAFAQVFVPPLSCGPGYSDLQCRRSKEWRQRHFNQPPGYTIEGPGVYLRVQPDPVPVQPKVEEPKPLSFMEQWMLMRAQQPPAPIYVQPAPVYVLPLPAPALPAAKAPEPSGDLFYSFDGETWKPLPKK